jgi:hypothetical protein
MFSTIDRAYEMNVEFFFLVFDLSVYNTYFLSPQEEVARELQALAREIERSKVELDTIIHQYEQLLADEEEIIKG